MDIRGEPASPAPSQVCGKRLTADSRPEIQVSGISQHDVESHQYQLSAEEITNHLPVPGQPCVVGSRVPSTWLITPACQSASGVNDPPAWAYASPWWVSKDTPSTQDLWVLGFPIHSAAAAQSSVPFCIPSWSCRCWGIQGVKGM